MPTLDRSRYASADGLRRGAYVLSRSARTASRELILIASGSEVGLILGARRNVCRRRHRGSLRLDAELGLFDALPQSYRDAVLPPSVPARLAVEAGVAQGWHRYVGDAGDVLSVERFGASAPGDVLLREYGFTVEEVCRRARALHAQGRSAVDSGSR